MLRELSQLLGELHDGLLSIEARGGVTLTQIDMTLPLEVRPVFRNGGCVLLADVARSRDVNEWMASPSKLRLAWGLDAGNSAPITDALPSAHAREGGNPVPLALHQVKTLNPPGFGKSSAVCRNDGRSLPIHESDTPMERKP